MFIQNGHYEVEIMDLWIPERFNHECNVYYPNDGTYGRSYIFAQDRIDDEDKLVRKMICEIPLSRIKQINAVYDDDDDE